MKEFLEKIQVIKYFTTTLEIDQNEFVNRFRKNVDEGSTSDMVNVFEILSPSKNKYKGSVGFDKFDIKKRRQIYDNIRSIAVAKGTITKEQNSIVIKTEINGLNPIMTIYFFLFVLIFLIQITMAIVTPLNNGILFPFLILALAFMLGIPYLMMRRSVKTLKHDLERDFFFFTRSQ
jgi:hypothetical protein